MGLGLLFDYLLFDKFIGISFVIYAALLLAILFSLLKAFKIPYNKVVFWYVLPILFFATMTAVRGSKFLQFWDFVLTMGLLLLFSHQLIGRSIKNCLFLDYVKTAVLLPLNMLGKSFNSMGRLLKFGSGIRDSRKSSQVAKGILITLPIAIFFVALLASADLAFNRLVAGIFNFNININPSVVAQIWWALVFAFIWLGTYIYILENVNVAEAPPFPERPLDFKLGTIEAGILFGTLNALFLLFVLVQLHYLFAGQSAITSLGFTYAEYAHKGFVELVAVALLTFGLIFIAEKYIGKKDSGHFSWFKVLSGTLIILTLVIMASAFMRLNIYEQAYSFTLLRVLVQAFIIWLAAVFLWLGYKILFGVNNRSFVFGIFLSVIAFFVVFNLLNPEAFIVRKNIDQFAQEGKLDTGYLFTLSSDAVPEIFRLLQMPGLKDRYGQELPALAATTLKLMRSKESGQPWQSFNFSRNSASQIIDSDWEQINNLSNTGNHPQEAD